MIGDRPQNNAMRHFALPSPLTYPPVIDHKSHQFGKAAPGNRWSGFFVASFEAGNKRNQELQVSRGGVEGHAIKKPIELRPKQHSK